MTKSKVNSIYGKLLKVKEAVTYIKKDSKAQFHYASPSAVLSQLNPVLNEYGLILKPEVLSMTTERVTYNTQNGEKTETLFLLNMRMTWIDTITGEVDINLWAASGCNGKEQGFGSALTYGERYFMLKYFNIPTDRDDPDAFEDKYASTEVKQAKAAKVQAKAKADLEKVRLDAYVEIGAAKTVDELQAYFKTRKALYEDKAITNIIGTKYKAAVGARKEELMELELVELAKVAEDEAEARDKELREKP